MTVYLDCNATTPLDSRVREEVLRYLTEEFGNAGSRTHEYGARANQAVQHARDQIAGVVKAERDEVIFTSGATESNNLAILGLVPYGKSADRKHIISTMIEHKAVLEPLDALAQQGFEITLVSPTRGGWVDPLAVRNALRKDTLLVSVMHVNNETGVVQPIPDLCEILTNHPVFLHVDAAQGFGKEIAALQNPRIDFISISSHKIFGPKGVGALVARRRGFNRPPLTPLLFGGGQERGLRPGTLPVPLVAGFGLAAELALKEVHQRKEACQTYRNIVLEALKPLHPVMNGDPTRTLPHVLNLSFPNLDSEALMIALKNIIAISNGSACTSQSYQPSHVLKAMGATDSIIQSAVRLSWSHLTEGPDWNEVAKIIERLY
ncbi:MAG TPA: cysteine desulfurase DndA [Blastocatellia bacterium]|nr:cysteine desulfurase DndA [Blastocatellia bacterium]